MVPEFFPQEHVLMPQHRITAISSVAFGVVGIVACLFCNGIDHKMTNKIEVFLENTENADKNVYHGLISMKSRGCRLGIRRGAFGDHDTRLRMPSPDWISGELRCLMRLLDTSPYLNRQGLQCLRLVNFASSVLDPSRPERASGLYYAPRHSFASTTSCCNRFPYSSSSFMSFMASVKGSDRRN